MSVRRKTLAAVTGSMPPPPLQFSGSQRGDQPPPSSVAVIVQNLSKNGSGSSRMVDRDTFQQLLAEVMGTDGDPSDASLEDNVRINYKVVEVVMEAGISVLLNGDPFASTSDLLLQATNSLLVVRLTIQRSPQVLFCQPPVEHAAEPNQPILFLWLLPRLFPLLGHKVAESIKLELIQTIEAILIAAAKESEAWKYLTTVMGYCRSCITCIIDSFHSTAKITAAMSNSFRLELPDEDFSINLSQLPTNSPPVMHQSLRFVIKDPENAACVAIHLFAVLSRISTSSDDIPTLRTAADNYLGFLQNISKLWKSMRIWESIPMLQSKVSRIRINILEALESSLGQIPRSQYGTIKCDNLCLLIVRCASETLGQLVEQANQPTELVLASVFLRVLLVAGDALSVDELLREQALPVAFKTMNNDITWEIMDRDLQMAVIRLVLDVSKDPEITRKARSLLQPGTERGWNFRNKKLQEEADRLRTIEISEYLQKDNNGGRRKRPRLMTKDELPSVETHPLVLETFRLLGYQGAAGLQGLSTVVLRDAFNKIDEDDQCTVVQSLGLISCILAGNLTEGPELDQRNLQSARSYADERNDVLFTVLEVLQKLDNFRGSSRVRVWGLMGIRRILNHTRNLKHLSLFGAFGKCCFESLKSSRREIRIAAGRTLPSFVGFSHDEGLLKENRIEILRYLRAKSMSDELQYQETFVLAWSQIGRVSAGSELNFSLIRLVEYLGHANSFIIGVAYNEIQFLAEIHDVSPKQLFTQYWRSISASVVKQLQSKPQIAGYLSDILGITVDDFLGTTQTYTLPYMILWKRVEIVERVAQACGKSAWVVCHENMTFILSVLLAQDVGDIEQTTMALLINASENFKSCSLRELVRPEKITLATELLKAAGDADQENKEPIYRALALVAELSRTTKSAESKEAPLDEFFKLNVLGIFTEFMTLLKEAPTPMVEKIRIIKAIEEMVILAGGYISGALPQICACLQSALETEQLRTSALYAWSAIITTLPAEVISPLLVQTFSVILQYWNDFQDDARKRAQEIITHFFNKYSRTIEKDVGMIPSLALIPSSSHFETQLKEWRCSIDVKQRFDLLSRRCRHENVAVVEQALIELTGFIRENQAFIHTAAINEQPDEVVPQLIRTLLDVVVAFKNTDLNSNPKVQLNIQRLCAESLGLIGAVDPNRVETTREIRDMMVLHNFEKADETVEFVVFFLEEKIVKAFLSATDTKVQAFLAFGMQELLRFIEVGVDVSRSRGARVPHSTVAAERWASFSTTARSALTPFLGSKYILQQKAQVSSCSYPVFSLNKTHRSWLHLLLMDLLSKARGVNAEGIFSTCGRMLKGQDISISLFLLPFVTLNVIIAGEDIDRKNIASEILAVLRPTEGSESIMASENLKQCTETVFLLIDHLTRWLRDKKKLNSSLQVQRARQQNRHVALEDDTGKDIAVDRVESVLSVIPPDMMGIRSFECQSYARALFYWEQHIRQKRDTASEDEMTPLYERLQHIYTQIDEPDGIEGWKMDSCTELSPGNMADGMMANSQNPHPRILEFAIEASWISGKWDVLDKYLMRSEGSIESSYEIKIGSALSALRKQDTDTFAKEIARARENVVSRLSESLTGSLRQCHDSMVKLHSLSEIEEISLTLQQGTFDKASFSANLERRLDVMGTYSNHKQYILALRRAVFQLSGAELAKDNIASTWLASARFARKAGQIHQSFNSVLHASRLGAPLATVEHAKLLWHEGQHRKAIQNLEGAISSNMIQTNDSITETIQSGKNQPQNIVSAKAILLLARWLDGAGQTHSKEIISKYTKASSYFVRWEQGHYFLGRHYNKLHEAEKGIAPLNQSQPFLNGETARLVCQSYLRALAFGTKYIFQTMPRVLTLWLDLGENQELGEVHGSADFRSHILRERLKNLTNLHLSVQKYSERLPAWMFYTAFPQIISRIVHPSQEVYTHLQNIIVKVVSTHPRQALWSLTAVCKSTSRERSSRGARITNRIKENYAAKGRREADNELKNLILQSQKLTDQLLRLCDADLPSKAVAISLTKDLGFHHSVAPCMLVVPLQTVLTVTLPPTPESIKIHVPFNLSAPTIAGFADDADIMSSLQKPRKIKMRGSDGKMYPFLCKPKDDLRKDARLMEFNNMINRFLKKDTDSSRRRLYIRTYMVTPLNEECGLIEWVNNVRPLRDILLKSYKAKGIIVQYSEIRVLLDKACSDPSKSHIFTDSVLPRYPPVFHEWFVEMFSGPAAWFASRVGYSRTSAVMSMVGHILGLGDRHGENILFDETNGDTLHVDFNCLFDKGLGFEKPERVPFRLTHNMVDALGVTGYEGTFRRTCETTLRVLRNNEDTLMTVLETFLHDPAVDMVKKKKANIKIPETPKDVLKNIQNKLRGLFQGETVPLSVEGQVQELLRSAVDPGNLCAMYIGWCAFL
ncbi:uncharacterized protein LAJ45_01987 [Morchella importuna]|uniref:uncharacterized protein n=1 Tax=Morchella importuna TaxID=1174673 RepID=UPI001E8DEAD3|nr:uncharacterized protein LAJ45_01987 [Morchella importuna]KAH8154219.1 hypothetical protein LAJ45_01987 [Morchella importuna]